MTTIHYLGPESHVAIRAAGEGSVEVSPRANKPLEAVVEWFEGAYRRTLRVVPGDLVDVTKYGVTKAGFEAPLPLDPHVHGAFQDPASMTAESEPDSGTPPEPEATSSVETETTVPHAELAAEPEPEPITPAKPKRKGAS